MFCDRQCRRCGGRPVGHWPFWPEAVIRRPDHKRRLRAVMSVVKTPVCRSESCRSATKASMPPVNRSGGYRLPAIEHLKDVFGDIQSDRANHAPWRALPHVDFRQPHFGTLRCRERRPSTTSGQGRQPVSAPFQLLRDPEETPRRVFTDQSLAVKPLHKADRGSGRPPKRAGKGSN